MTALWAAIAIGGAGSYGLKLLGVSLPGSLLARPRVQRIAGLLPVSMLAALIVVELFDNDNRYHFDWETTAGVGAAAIALLLKQGFLVVFLTAIVTSAVLRALA